MPGIGFNSNRGRRSDRAGDRAAISGTGSTLAISTRRSNVFRALNQAWKAGFTVQLSMGTGGNSRYLISGLSAADQQQLVTSLALKAERSSETGVPVKKPRIGLFEPVNESQDAGWTRWLFEQYGLRHRHASHRRLPFAARKQSRCRHSGERRASADRERRRRTRGRSGEARAEQGAVLVPPVQAQRARPVVARLSQAPAVKVAAARRRTS